MEIEHSTLQSALLEAQNYHQEYETNLLGGMEDEAWADWYAAFLVGKVPELQDPAYLTQVLQMAGDMHEREVNQDSPWPDFIADYLIQHLSGQEEGQ